MSDARVRAYMVRAMGSTEADLALFKHRSVVAVGWSRVNLADPALQVTAALEQHLRREYPKITGKQLAAVRRFQQLRPGDLLVIPHRSKVLLAHAAEEAVYDPVAGAPLDLANQRRVRYLCDKDGPILIPRTRFSAGLQQRLRVPGSIVADLVEFADELRRFFEDPQTLWQDRLERAERQQGEEWQRRLLSNICQGRTNLQAGGLGLEGLIAHLLELDGYRVKVLGKTAFPGSADAELEASREDRFSNTRLLVQVKHHRGESGSSGATQLESIQRLPQEEYPHHQLVLVTTAEASADLVTCCQAARIKLMAGRDVARWLYERRERLALKWRTCLGISKIPQLLF